MHKFSTIFFHFITFIAGGMCFINMSQLLATNPNFEASWWKVTATIIIGTVAAVYTHTESRRSPHY
jgi:hypothetical protein